MNISYKWLKRYIDFDMTPRELAAALTSLGLECDTVEEVETIRGGLRGIVIGKVLTCEEHPNSDHLHITTVDLGMGEPVQIVCGAPNVAAGQTVVVATLGAHLYDGDKEFVIKKSKMRGVESLGMICAEDEIGLGEGHDGIMVIPEEVTPGTPAAEYFNVESDYMLEVELTPNRVDGASHYGVARDLKAYIARHSYGNDPAAPMPHIELPDTNGVQPDKAEGGTPVRVEDAQGCPRYSGVTIRGVRVEESPEWLKSLLVAAGQRPINNIVDITNYVLLGLGQPLHCFDLNKVEGGEIVVRTCPEGTEFVTLDGEKHKLSAADLMICDSKKPLCIAGVFGGLDSGVTEQTTDVFIESAWFNPTRVRRTARRHGLSTDASFRYERGTDPDITLYAARLAAMLIKEIAGGEICGGFVDICAAPIEKAKVDLPVEYCNNLVGNDIPLPLMRRILESLEISELPGSTDEVLKLAVPTYRVDVTRPCDVVEEILRVYGYNNVEFGTEMHANLSLKGDTDAINAMQQKISDALTARGFQEILNNSLSAASYYENNEDFAPEECVRLLNPLSSDLSVMRRTLLYGGLESIAHNVNRKSPDLKFYEFGNVYSRKPGVQSTVERPLAPFSERASLGIWMTGSMTATSWNAPRREATVYDLRAELESIMRSLGIAPGMLTMEQASDHTFSAKITYNSRSGKRIAEAGLIRKDLLAKFDISQPVAFADVDIQELYSLTKRQEVTYRELPKTQPVRRDLALLLDSDVKFADVAAVVAKCDRKLIKDVTLFDVYEGKNIPSGKKSYAVAVTLQDNEKTLTDQRIDAVMNKVMASLTKEVGAQLR